MPEFDRTVERIDGTAYFVTVCHDCGESFHSRTLGRMPEWEHAHQKDCPVLQALEA